MKYIAVALALFLHQGIASALCIGMTLEWKFQRAQEVMIVRVTEVKREGEEGRFDTKYRAKYIVLESFKRLANHRDDVYSTTEVHDIALSPGQTYLFFIPESRHVGSCGGSRTWPWNSPEPDDEAAETLNELRRLRDNGVPQESP